MSNKLCIIIDDVNQKRVFESVVAKPLKREGIHVDAIFVNTTDTDLLDNDQNIVLEKLRIRLTEIFRNKHIDVVATDFDLSDDNVCGINVVELIYQIRPKVPVILYSGKLGSVIKHLLGDHTQKTSDELVKSIKKLIKYNIVDYVEREGYPHSIIKILKDNQIYISSLLPQKLREYSNLEFKSCYPFFAGRTLGSIADEIESHTPQGREFQEQLYEQVIAHMIKINNYEE